MAPLPYRWRAVPGAPYEIAEPLQTERGNWLCAARWVDTGTVFAGADGDTADEVMQGVAGVLAFAVAARKITGPAFPPVQAATEPTPIGLQYVIPGCEKDQTRGPAQMSLF